jgi:hypothetical protein
MIGEMFNVVGQPPTDSTRTHALAFDYPLLPYERVGGGKPKDEPHATAGGGPFADRHNQAFQKLVARDTFK